MNFGCVYLICDPANNTFKIGVTRDSENKRLKKLQTGNSTELHLVQKFICQYPFRLEKMLHNYFQNKHELNEWYNLDINDISNFNAICIMLNEKIKYMVENNPFFAKNIC